MDKSKSLNPFVPVESMKSLKHNRFFTVRAIKVMGDIIPIQDESFFKMVGDYITNPTAIIKALQSSDEDALFFGTNVKWCAYVSGRYITSNQVSIKIGGQRYVRDSAHSWELQEEFWRNLPTSNDLFILELNNIKHIQMRILSEKIRTQEEEERRQEEDRAQLDRIQNKKLREEISDALEGGPFPGKRPITFFVKHYLDNPDKLNEFNVLDLLDHPEYWTIKWPYKPNFSTLTKEEENDMKQLTSLSREEIMSDGNISGKKGKDGLTFIVTANSEAQYAVKTYHSERSIRMIEMEAYLQEKAATEGVCPKIYGINLEEKYIIMEKMKETIVTYARRENPKPETGKHTTWELPEQYQDRIIEIMYGLDRAGVIHNDGNPLNLMFNDDTKLMVIDFGFSSLIDDAMLQKRGPHPNINLTLWGFQRQLRYYRIATPKIEQTIGAYMEAWNKSQKKLTSLRK
jgi:tRNA A-37 threonylcarbamoyl transferase component Bud32